MLSSAAEAAFLFASDTGMWSTRWEERCRAGGEALGPAGQSSNPLGTCNGAASGKSLSTVEPRYLFCKKKKIQSTRIDNIFLKFKIIIYMGYACASVYFPKNNYLIVIKILID